MAKRKQKLVSDYLRLKSPTLKQRTQRSMNQEVKTPETRSTRGSSRVWSEGKREIFESMISVHEKRYLEKMHLRIANKATATVISARKTRFGGFISPQVLNRKLILKHKSSNEVDTSELFKFKPEKLFNTTDSLQPSLAFRV